MTARSLATDSPDRLDPAAPPLQLVCSEVWGGNRPIHAPVELPGLKGVLYSHPCNGGRGGDVHYLSVCGSGVLARACLADVVGHGETVSRVSGEIHAHLRRCMDQPDQRKVLAKLNGILEARGLDAMTTAAAITYYPPLRRLSISYAGHPPGWYFSAATKSWERLMLDEPPGADVNLPLAVCTGVRYTRRRVKAAPGDRLLLITDGVLEAISPMDGEMFDAQGVEEVLDAHGRGSCAQIADGLLAALAEHTGQSTPMHDDVTFLLVEIVPGPRGLPVWFAIKNRILRPRGSATTGVYAHPVGA